MGNNLRTVTLNNPVYIIASCAAGTAKEREGPLGGYFDILEDDVKFGKKSFEAGESEMQRLALNTAIKKSGLHTKQIDCILAGDLLNQNTGSTYGLLEFDLPFIGLFGACSTAAESLALGGLLIDGGHFNTAAAVTSSHFCAAERQFRFPLEYGGQRTPTAQWTATASGAFVLSGNSADSSLPKITEVLFGKIVDKGITDAANMGAAMAPAACDTLLTYFRETGADPAAFDIIATGDLGAEGARITENLLESEGLTFAGKYNDCGLLIYDLEKQDVHAGASGCGCSAAVAAGYFMEMFRQKRFKNILLVGTGALMSPGSVMQGNSIPGVAHLVHIQA